MKKTLLTPFALMLGISAMLAQTGRQALPGKLYYKVRQMPVVEGTATGNNTNKLIHSPNEVQADLRINSSRNGYGTINEDNNVIHYDQDLNMILFTNRIPTAADWPVTGLPTSGVSGFITSHYSTDNGATWSGVCYSNNGTDFSRHPSGVIANTPGNTDPAQAKFVCVGPALTGGADFKSSYFASIEANATGNITTNDQQTVNALMGSGTFADGSSIYFNSLINNGMTAWCVGRKETTGGFVDLGPAIFKGVTSGGAYTWTQDSTSFGTYMVNAAGTYYCSTPKIAFSPDGMTGYVLVNGILASATGENAKSLQPNLFKSIDAGATWTLVNADYNWRGNHPEILCNLIPTANDADWNGGINETYPAFLDPHGGGITVDNNGTLHYMTTVVPAYSSHPDSAYYIYTQYGFTYTQYDDVDKPWIYDFTTNGNGVWDQKIVGKLFTRNIEADDLVPDPAIWTMDGTAAMDYTNRMRITRSTDGTKVFYSWTDGDTNNIVTGTPNVYHANSNPSVEYRGLDVASGMLTPQKELSAFDAFEAGYYNYNASTIAMPIGTTGYRIPATYIVSQAGDVNLINAVDHQYITNLDIGNTEYTTTVTSNTNIIADQNLCVHVIGIKDLVGSSISSVGQNFPNPFNASSAVKVNLNKPVDITLTVTNSIGQIMSIKTIKGSSGVNELGIDASDLSTGLYFYTIIAGDSKITRKMTVVK